MTKSGTKCWGRHLIFCSLALREKCPYLELFWPTFSRIRTEQGEIRSMRMRENMDQNNSEYGHFSLSMDDFKTAVSSLGGICGNR